MVILRKRESREWIEVDLGDVGKISLQIRRPTYAELVECVGEESAVAYRLRRNVVGWAGVLNEKGEEIPFSHESFATLCEAFPRVMVAAAIACHKAYEGMTEIAAKN